MAAITQISRSPAAPMTHRLNTIQKPGATRFGVASSDLVPFYDSHLRCLQRGPPALGSLAARLSLILRYVSLVISRELGFVPIPVCAHR